MQILFNTNLGIKETPDNKEKNSLPKNKLIGLVSTDLNDKLSITIQCLINKEEIIRGLWKIDMMQKGGNIIILTNENIYSLFPEGLRCMPSEEWKELNGVIDNYKELLKLCIKKNYDLEKSFNTLEEINALTEDDLQINLSILEEIDIFEIKEMDILEFEINEDSRLDFVKSILRHVLQDINFQVNVNFDQLFWSKDWELNRIESLNKKELAQNK